MTTTELLLYVQDRWEMVRAVARQRSQATYALLHAAHLDGIDSEEPLTFVVGVDYRFHLDTLRDPEKRYTLEWAITQVIDQSCHVRLILAPTTEAAEAVTFDEATLRRLIFARWLFQRGILNEGCATDASEEE